MSKEFLTRLYWACVDPCSNGEQGTNLCELYECFEETEKALELLTGRLNELGVSDNKLDNLHHRMAWAFEQQGFINGFRLGMKLAVEVGRK